MVSLENLNDLFIHELRDLDDAEQQLAQTLPLLAQAATSGKLRRGFEEHLAQTKEQARRLEQIFRALAPRPRGKRARR